jgi:hypothetical protein
MNLKTLIEQVLGGVAKGKTLKDLAKKHHTPLKTLKKEFKKGETVEQEHLKKAKVSKKTKKKTAGKIAKDHLFEIPKYYTKLKKIEKKK